MHGDERGLGRQHHARFLKASTIEPRLRLISRCEVFTGLYAWKSRSQSPGVQDQGEASITDLPPIVVSDFFGVPPQHRLQLGSVRPEQLGGIPRSRDDLKSGRNGELQLTRTFGRSV